MERINLVKRMIRIIKNFFPKSNSIEKEKVTEENIPKPTGKIFYVDPDFFLHNVIKRGIEYKIMDQEFYYFPVDKNGFRLETGISNNDYYFISFRSIFYSGFLEMIKVSKENVIRIDLLSENYLRVYVSYDSITHTEAPNIEYSNQLPENIKLWRGLI